jgi:hypothetical protein
MPLQALGIAIKILRDNSARVLTGIYRKKKAPPGRKLFGLTRHLLSRKPEDPPHRWRIKERLPGLEQYPGYLGILPKNLRELLALLFGIESQKKIILRQKQRILPGKVEGDPYPARKKGSYPRGGNGGNPGIREKKS